MLCKTPLLHLNIAPILSILCTVTVLEVEPQGAPSTTFFLCDCNLIFLCGTFKTFNFLTILKQRIYIVRLPNPMSIC